MRYGFKVFTFEVKREARKRASRDLGSDFGKNYRSELERVLTGAIGRRLTGKPALDFVHEEMPNPEQGHPMLEITRVAQRGRRLSIEVISAGYQDHDDLITSTGSERMADRGAGRRHRLDFYFPDQGDVGILVVEAVKNATPVVETLRWIARLDAERFAPSAASSLADDGIDEVEEADDPGEDDVETWHRFSVGQLGDLEHLRSLVRNAKSTVVSFTRSEVTPRGRPRKKEAEYTVYTVSNSQSDALAKEMMRWLQGSRDGAVSAVQRAVGLDPARFKKANMSFNFTTISVKGEESATITPSTVSDYFTYPINHSIRPSKEGWRDATRPKASELSVGEGIEITIR